MNEREAFEAEMKAFGHLDMSRSELRTDWYSNSYVQDHWTVWRMACAYQRKKDAEKCQQMALYTGVDCADAILKGDE